MTEKPLGFGYQVGAGAIAGVSEVEYAFVRDGMLKWLTDRFSRFYLCLFLTDVRNHDCHSLTGPLQVPFRCGQDSSVRTSLHKPLLKLY
jgi:hypothetical protein